MIKRVVIDRVTCRQVMPATVVATQLRYGYISVDHINFPIIPFDGFVGTDEIELSQPLSIPPLLGSCARSKSSAFQLAASAALALVAPAASPGNVRALAPGVHSSAVRVKPIVQLI